MQLSSLYPWMPLSMLFELAACIASLAIATPCDILLLPPVTSWSGEIVQLIVALIRAASIPVISLQSVFKRESFLLSEIWRLLAFFLAYFRTPLVMSVDRRRVRIR